MQKRLCNISCERASRCQKHGRVCFYLQCPPSTTSLIPPLSLQMPSPQHSSIYIILNRRPHHHTPHIYTHTSRCLRSRSPAHFASLFPLLPHTHTHTRLQDASALQPGAFYLDRTPQPKHLRFAGTEYGKQQVEQLWGTLEGMCAGKVVPAVVPGVAGQGS